MRACLGNKVIETIKEYSGKGSFFSPQICFDDAHKYLPPLLEKKGESADLFYSFLEEFKALVSAIPENEYQHLELPARTRISDVDEDDWPIVACAMLLNCPIWTEDRDFFGIGIPVWNSRKINLYLD